MEVSHELEESDYTENTTFLGKYTLSHSTGFTESLVPHRLQPEQRKR